MTNVQGDLTQIYFEATTNLMSIVEKIIEADLQNQDYSSLVKELTTCFQVVKQAQEEREHFYEKIKEAKSL